MTTRLIAIALLLAGNTTFAQVPGVAGTLIVTNKSTATATIIDVGSGTTLATLPTGNGPHEVALSSDGRTAVLTDYGTGPAPGSTLTVIDVPGRRVARTIDLGQYRRPHGVVWLPGDSLVVVTSEASQNVVIVAVGDGAVRRAIPTRQAGSHMVAVTRDGTRAWTGNIGANTVSELDLVNGTFLRTIDVPAQPEAIGIVPDAREVWVGSNATGRVTMIEPTSALLKTIAEGVTWPYRILFTPDLRTVIIPDLTNQEIRFIDHIIHRELGRLRLPEAGPQGITVSPNGFYLFASLSTQSRVAIIEISSRTVLGHVPAGPTPDGVAYTPNVNR